MPACFCRGTHTLWSSPDAWAGFYTTACLLCFDCDPPCRGSAGPMLSDWTHWRHPRTYSRTFPGLTPQQHSQSKILMLKITSPTLFFLFLLHITGLFQCFKKVFLLDFVSPASTNIDAQTPLTQTSSLSFSLFLILFLGIEQWIHWIRFSAANNDSETKSWTMKTNLGRNNLKPHTTKRMTNQSIKISHL